MKKMNKSDAIMGKKPVIVIGAGGHAQVLLDVLLEQGVQVLGMTDVSLEKKGQKYYGIPVLGQDDCVDRYAVDTIELVNGIGSVGDTSLRRKIYERFKYKGYTFKTVVHSTAIISNHVKLSEGVQVMPGAILNAGTAVGENSIINTGVIIDHGCQIGAHVHIAPGSVLSGGINIDDGSHLGTGCVIIQGISIGEQALIGAGAVVVNDVLPLGKVFGVPARKR